MGLLTLIQIPCHHVLATEIALNLKYRIGIKNVFNLNLGIGIIKKNYLFCLYFQHISPCFYSNFNRESSLDAELNSATSSFHFFQVFLVFGVVGSVKSMLNGYSLDAELNSAPNELSRLKFE